MEREFLAGIDFNLYVDKETYVRWVGLLEGLVMAKERGSRQWRKTRETPRALTVTRLLAPLTVPSKGRTWSARARSSSPTHFPRAQDSPHSAVNALPRYSPEMLVDLQSSLRSRCKRSAFDAFSPNSAAFEITRPAKRPVSLAVEIPQSTAAGLNTPSPLESLQCFSRLSLGSSPALSQTTEGTAVSAFGRNVPPQTLIASYRLDPTKPRPVPKVGVFTNWVIWVHALTQPSICTSIRWQDPLWRKTADHARAYCGIISPQRLQRLHILHTTHLQCRTRFNLLRRAPIILVSRYLLCYPHTRRCLGPVPQLAPLCHTIQTILAGLKCRNPFQVCVRQRTDQCFWHLLLTPDLLAYNIITLHRHTLPIIIGVVVVAFNIFLFL